MKASLKVDWYHQIPPSVKEIIQRINQGGRKAYLVGGAVRDLLLQKAPKDFDLVSEASVEEIEEWFPRTLPLGKAFGIMSVIMEDRSVEVARFRTDGEYTDGRRPDTITFTDPAQDAERRDFTINALFYDLASQEVIDYVGGLEDLKVKTLRTVGDAEKRFEEDSLRMLRAARFLAQLPDFTLDPAAMAAIKKLSPQIQRVSQERIRQEWEKMLLGPGLVKGLQCCMDSGLWKEILDIPSPTPALLAQLEKIPSSGRARLLAALVLMRLDSENEKVLAPFSKEPKLLKKVLAHLEIHQALDKFEALPLVEKKKLSVRPEADLALQLFTLAKEVAGKKIRAWIEDHTQKGSLNPAPYFSGKDLLAMGIPAGPNVGKILEELRALQLGEKISSQEQALGWVKKNSSA